MGALKMSGSSLPRGYYLFMRAHKENMFSWGWATLIGSLIAGRGFPSIIPTIIALFSVIAIASCVYFYNDVIDLEMDKINPIKRNRPLPSGMISKETAMQIVYISGLLGVILSMFLNPISFIFCLSYLFLFFIYSYPPIRLKKRFVIKEITVAFGYILTTLIGGTAISGSFQSTFIFAGVLYFFFSFFGMPLFHDISDVKEDQIYGVKTMALVLSWRRKVEMITFFLLAIMTLTPFTYVSLGFNIILPIVVVAGGLIALRFLIPITSTFDNALFKKARIILYIYYIGLQITLILGTIPFILP
jgi:4-hydroxybenzoate polyprenyltransferase